MNFTELVLHASLCTIREPFSSSLLRPVYTGEFFSLNSMQFFSRPELQIQYRKLDAALAVKLRCSSRTVIYLSVFEVHSEERFTVDGDWARGAVYELHGRLAYSWCRGALAYCLKNNKQGNRKLASKLISLVKPFRSQGDFHANKSLRLLLLFWDGMQLHRKLAYQFAEKAIKRSRGRSANTSEK